ncbi:MAG: DUF2726 domain-containing protein [Magnetospirillum sp.]|nr:DUF2726 domain-containing protein [Magnetospirillum sp.]
MESFIVLVLIIGLAAYLFRHPRPNGTPSAKTFPHNQKVNYAIQQLDTVMNSVYSPKKLMNSNEYKVFSIVEKELRRQRQGNRIFSQVSMGQILSASGAAYDAINSKRVDLLIIDSRGMPKVVIEHQGEGHNQGNAAARDAVKKEALRRAGIPLIETYDADSEEDVRHKVFSVLSRMI